MTDTQRPTNARGLDHDIDAILKAQHVNGAFPAGAEFSQYQYCWLRDGAFIANALDVAAERAAAAGNHTAAAERHQAAARFHGWVARTLETLEPGFYALANDRLGSKEFPKTDHALSLSRRAIDAPIDEALRILGEAMASHDLPDERRIPPPPKGSPIPLDVVKRLQAICVHTTSYGTVSSTICAATCDGGSPQPSPSEAADLVIERAEP